MASAKEKKLAMFRQWYKDAGFETDGKVHKAINHGLQSYRSNTIAPTSAFTRRCGKIMVATIGLFTERNSQIERWPTEVRKMLNRTTQDNPEQDASLEPFTTWARPRDIEKRKQAVAVWYNLIAFLAFHWGNYDKEKMIEKMGLKIRDERLKELIDDISLFSKMRKKTAAMTEAIEYFCRLAMTDEHATPTSNPLLWWIAVLVQSEVLDSQPRLPISGMVDQLDFEGKLNALDHYARPLMLHYAFEKSPGYPSEYVINSLDQTSITWVDFDQERPQTDSHREALILAHADWKSLMSEINDVVNTWCTKGSSGPMHTILCLRNSLEIGESLPTLKYESPDPTPELDMEHDQTPTGYKVMLHITESFTIDPKVNTQAYPAVCYNKKTLDEANRAVAKAFEDEVGGKKDALYWDKIIRSDGTVKIRAVFVHPFENAKAMAWVEKEYGDIEFDHDSGAEPDEDLDMEDSDDELDWETLTRASGWYDDNPRISP
jgi:hypothetical protein